MYGQEKRRNQRNVTLLMDWTHIVLGVIIVLMAVIAFLKPEENQFLFPIIFFLAAVLNLLNGIHRYKRSDRNRKKMVIGVGQLVIAILLLLIAVISAVSIWR